MSLRIAATCALLGAMTLALGAGCSTPVGVSRDDPRAVHRSLTESALSGDRPSAPTRELLTRLGLRERFARDPDAALAELHRGLSAEGDGERLFALAELSFLRAEQTGRADPALAAAVYAYAFLFASGLDLGGSPFDPRIPIARNLYNRGLTRGLASGVLDRVALESRRHELPFGTLDVLVAPDALVWAGWRLERFVPAADFRVRGLANRYRQAGIGAPLAASLGEPAGRPPPGAAYIAPRLKVPVTAFLRLDEVRRRLASGHLVGRLELYSEDEGERLQVDGRVVPLELERSSSLAYMLEGSEIWSFGLAGFRLGDYLPGGREERLVMLHPHRRGRIPLVLVHGTFSSPATWAELVNEVENDPELSTRYQVWLFVYNTGNPIAYSGGHLVQTLREAIAQLDPEGHDPALRRMVVVGHSQGGLLTKLTVVESGDRFWSNVSSRPFEAIELQPESRAVLRRSLFYEPLPFVGRVVFMATPHRGSFLSDFRVASWLSRLVKMPASLTKLTYDLATHGSDELYLRRLDRMPTSLDNMASRNPFLRTLAELPIASGVAVHSIVAVRGDGPPEQGSDGVVRYVSAHLDDADSERVVRSNHSVQVRPEAIQELRRILLLHAGAR
jgi:hypothetical protein